MPSKNKIQKLMEKGVTIPNPDTIQLGEDVDPDRISGEGVVIYSGCKIFGKSTLILQGVQLGYEGPSTIENCRLGPDVKLNGGYFKDAVFLEGAGMGLGAHVREGAILEEHASGAHTVALKQTLLFPFVTLGSLINFCDIFMSGGTSRKDHSEVGSSYIHFNYTPNQDKATPSLLGNVPDGVMLDQHPIFLGGQGGLVGPCRLAFGTVVAAGSLIRKDETRPDRMIYTTAGRSLNFPFKRNVYTNLKRVITLNVNYIANQIALNQWYRHVRRLFISERFPQSLHDALMDTLSRGIDERIKRLEKVYAVYPDFLKSKKPKGNGFTSDSHVAVPSWDEVKTFLQAGKKKDFISQHGETFLSCLEKSIQKTGTDYIYTIQSLEKNTKMLGSQWLQEIVDTINGDARRMIPTLA